MTASGGSLKTLGIDFGEKRIGVAISDDDGRIATPLETIQRRSDRGAIDRILELVEAEGIHFLVLGEPLGIDGSRGPAAARTASFGRKLAAATGLEVQLIDEALTTFEARERLREAGVDARRHPERLDALAAQILLQEALDQRRDDQG